MSGGNKRGRKCGYKAQVVQYGRLVLHGLLPTSILQRASLFILFSTLLSVPSTPYYTVSCTNAIRRRAASLLRRLAAADRTASLMRCTTD